MIPTVQQVFDLTRIHCGDTAVVGGQWAKNPFLFQIWPAAYEGLVRFLELKGNKRLRQTRFYNVPAYTGRLLPSDMGLTSVGRIENMWGRPIAYTATATIVSVNTAVAGTPSYMQVSTSSPHGLLAGQQVDAFQFGMAANTVSEDANGEWYVTVPDSTHLNFLGCSAIDLGGAVGSTGIITTGSQDWSDWPLQQLFDIHFMPRNAGNSQLTQWKWENGAFYFNPSTTNQEIRFTFSISGTPPTDPTFSVLIDDSLDPLASYLGGLACSSKGVLEKASELFYRAVGNESGDLKNVVGGGFSQLAQLGMQDINMTPIIMPPYRNPRNLGPFPSIGRFR